MIQEAAKQLFLQIANFTSEMQHSATAFTKTTYDVASQTLIESALQFASSSKKEYEGLVNASGSIAHCVVETGKDLYKTSPITFLFGTAIACFLTTVVTSHLLHQGGKKGLALLRQCCPHNPSEKQQTSRQKTE